MNSQQEQETGAANNPQELDQTNSNAEPEAPNTLLLEIEADPTLGYASIQNSVPVVRALRVTSRFKTHLDDVEILINCNPRFAQSTKLRFAKLAPDESRRISPLDLAPDHSYLADLQEAVTASITVVAQTGDTELARVSQIVEVLAYDQWAGTRALPELLAAFFDAEQSRYRHPHRQSVEAASRPA